MSYHSHQQAQDGDVQIKEGELAWTAAVFVDEATGEVAAEDGAEVVLGDLGKIN